MDDDLVRQGLRFVLIALPILFSPVAWVVAIVLIIEAVERKRTSLRALLIATTLIAIVLKVAGYAFHD
jgi:cytochrome c biogenesis factor